MSSAASRWPTVIVYTNDQETRRSSRGGAKPDPGTSAAARAYPSTAARDNSPRLAITYRDLIAEYCA